MLDKALNAKIRRPLDWIANKALSRGFKPNAITWIGFLIGLQALPLIAAGITYLAIIPILVNRLIDGIDGAMARKVGATDLGAFLDISLDFLFYSSIPLAFAIRSPQLNALASSVLIYTFLGTGCTFLAYAILATKRSLENSDYPEKGFFYLGGLTESTETVIIFVIMCLFPRYYASVAYVFAALCIVTTITRIVGGIKVLGRPNVSENR
jgi:phosphatidylglycerophosphate synthase